MVRPATATQPLILEELTTRDGLPQGTVIATLQDSQGFVWLGTEDGLVRFDGRELYRYAYSPAAVDGLPGNFIGAIAEDQHGDLWIGAKGSGLAKWRRATDTFMVYRHDPGDPTSLASDTVRGVIVDTAGTVWIATLDAGLDVLEPGATRFRHFRHQPAQPGSLADDQVQTVFQDHNGTVWIGTHAGLDRWQPASRTFAHVRLHADAASDTAEQISHIAEDVDGSLWVGTFDSGLYHIERSGILVGHFRHDSARSTSLSNDDVRAVLDDQAGHLWVGTADGLNLLDRQTQQFKIYRHDKEDRGSLSDSFIMTLYQDTAGLVWIGTRTAGVSRWDPHSWELGGNRPAWLNGKLVTAFAADTENKLWIGSLGGGLVQFDAATGEAIDIDSILHHPNALTDRRVMALQRDRHGALWIGTMSKGLMRFAEGQLISIPVKPGDPHSVSAPGIMALLEARNGLLWIGTHGGGADILDPSTGLVRQLPFSSTNPGALSSENITSFLEDRRGYFWIGTDSGGLNLARPDGTVIKVFRNDPKKPHSLSANTIYSLAMDSRGAIWVGTDGGGLDLVVGSSAAPQDIRFENVSRAMGLSSDTIYSVLPDAAGRLWLSGNAGLMRYDPQTRAVKTFHRENGLQGEEFDFGAYFRAPDGRLCFGGPGGFNIFNPAHLSERRIPPRLALTHVEVLGAPLRSTTPYWLMKQIDLNYRANIVSLDFAPLDFTSVSRNQLAYRMTGLTEEWINLGALRRVTLTNLEAGNYVLEVRAVNGDSVASATPFRLSIHKDAAPWRSGAAYVAYVLCLVSLVVLGLRAQRQKLRNALAAQQRLESEVTLRTQQLQQANRDLVVASEAKSTFLARMGHELRTPMNGVVGMAELLARSPLTPPQARQTQTIRSSAQALLQILNDLLDLSKVQAGKIDLENLPLDLVQISEECTALFAGAAHAKGVDLIVSPPTGGTWNLLGDPLRIRQILMNLIGNAVKFTAKGEIVVTCNIAAQDEGFAAVTLSVADSGIGISESALAKIFEPFAQADETTTRRFGGTGLGLAICQEFVALMEGSIEVDSTPQKGSIFRVSLRLQIAPSRHQQPERLLAGWSATLITRQRSLMESIERYLSGFACSRCAHATELPEVMPEGGREILLLDVDSCPETLAVARECSPNERRFVVLATGNALESLRIESVLRPELIVRKPISRDALRDALSSAVRDVDVQRTTMTERSPGVPLRQGHILIVEDEGINAAVAEGYLGELGCTCEWVDNGAAAVARSSAKKFDIILMDLNMPGLDGYETAALIRKSEGVGARTPIVALTANDASVYRDSCLLAGMDGILSKPYSLDELSAVLHRWVKVCSTIATTEKSQNDSTATLATVDAATVAGLRRLRGAGTSDLYVTLIELFKNSSADSMQQISHCLCGGDLAAAAAASHKLKGAAGNLGALAFANALAELERACVSKERDRALRLYEHISAAHSLLLQELTSLSLQATA